MADRPTQIVFGVFKGMGDLLWAVPVITDELARGHEVHLLLFPSPALREFCSLVDFGTASSRLFIHPLPRTMRDALALIWRLRRVSPAMVWISPHAPSAASSWRIPLALWTLKHALWPGAQIVGASSEKLSRLFKLALPVDRKLPLKLREWSMYSMFREGSVAVAPPAPRFNSELMERAHQPPRFDLVIHPGATAENRIWPHSKYPELISRLPPAWRIAVLGLPGDVEPLRELLPPDRSIEFITGSLRESLLTIASARLLLVMDSGNLHFAEVLGRPAVAIFGKEDPGTIVPQGVVEAVYEKSVPCQPCGLAVCTQAKPFCLHNLSSELIAHRLIFLARERGKVDQSPGRQASFGSTATAEILLRN